MPPNRFESEVESFLEGSHGDRTHIKRADHPRLHHYAGRYSDGTIARQKHPFSALSWRAKASRVSRKRTEVLALVLTVSSHRASSSFGAKKFALLGLTWV